MAMITLFLTNGQKVRVHTRAVDIAEQHRIAAGWVARYVGEVRSIHFA